jgi:hypothetical protein
MSKPLAETSERCIRAFGPDGARRRNCTIETAEHLESLKLVIAQRTRRGKIFAIHFYGQSRIPLRARLKAGTRYSFLEAIGDQRTWVHSRLPSIPIDDSGLSASDAADAIDFARREAFSATILSVKVSEFSGTVSRLKSSLPAPDEDEREALRRAA